MTTTATAWPMRVTFPTAYGARGTVACNLGRSEVTLTTRAASIDAARAAQAAWMAIDGGRFTLTGESSWVDSCGGTVELTTWCVREEARPMRCDKHGTETKGGAECLRCVVEREKNDAILRAVEEAQGRRAASDLPTALREAALRHKLAMAKKHEAAAALLAGRVVEVDVLRPAIERWMRALRAGLQRFVEGRDPTELAVIDDAIRSALGEVDRSIDEARGRTATTIPDAVYLEPAPRPTPPPLPDHVCADCGGRIARGPSGLPCCAACAARLGADYRGSRAVSLASRERDDVPDVPDEGDYWRTRPGRRWLTALLTAAGVASGWFGRETLEAARSLVEHARTWWPW